MFLVVFYSFAESFCFFCKPLTLLGTIFGVWLNLMFPAVILIVLLAAVLGVSAWRTLARAMELYRKENLAKEGFESVPLTPLPERLPIATESEELQALLQSESRLPWKCLFALFAIWAVLSS